MVSAISVAYCSWIPMLALYIAHCARRKEFPKITALPFFRQLTAYAGWGLVVSFLGFGIARSLNYWRADLLCVLFWLLYLLFINWPKTQQWMTRGFLIGFLFLVIIGIAQFFVMHWAPHCNEWLATGAPHWLHRFAVKPEHMNRIHGPVHTLTYAETLAIAAIFVLSMGWNWRYMVLKGLFLVMVLASQSRGPFLAYCGGLAAYFLAMLVFQKQRRSYRIIVPIVLAGFFLIFSPAVRIRMGDGLGFAHNRDRFTMWKVGGLIIHDHPVFGVGIGHVRSVWTHYIPQDWKKYLNGANEVWSDVHSLYLQQTAERGIPGLGILLVLLCGFPVYLWKIMGVLRDKGLFVPSVLSAWAVSVAFLIMNLTESAFQDTEVVFCLYFVLALALAQVHEKVKQSNIS